MYPNSATSINDVETCAPPLPFIDGVHRAAGPAALTVVALSLMVWVASVRLRHAGWLACAGATRALAFILAASALMFAVAIPLSKTC